MRPAAASKAAVIAPFPRVRTRHPAAARAAQELGQDVPTGIAANRQPVSTATLEHLLDSAPELLGDNRFDLAGDEVVLRVPSALSTMLAFDPGLSVEDLDTAVDRVGEDGRQARLVS